MYDVTSTTIAWFNIDGLDCLSVHFNLHQSSGRPKLSIKREKRLFVDFAFSAQLSVIAAQFIPIRRCDDVVKFFLTSVQLVLFQEFVRTRVFATDILDVIPGIAARVGGYSMTSFTNVLTVLNDSSAIMACIRSRSMFQSSSGVRHSNCIDS
jgi:hypothetical protein